jgi:ADP-ribose pyrophosphatase
LNPESGQLQVVAIQRKDTGAWALPGGMVDPGENCSVTVKREFTEEAGEISDPARKAEFQRLTDELFASGTVIYRGYVDDPRNTDNAWMETTAFHFHCSAALGSLLPLEAGDDAAKVQWLDVDAANPHYAHLYAGHKDWVDEAQRRLSKSSL